jgi:Phage endonuclease I
MARKKVTKKNNSKWVARKHGYKSGLEESVSKQIESKGIEVQYESEEVSYTIPATEHTYHPDFRLPNGIIVETKGRFVIADRKKHLLVKEQNPQLDIRFVFTNSKNKINKKSKTTYGMWCEKNGFKYADKEIPDEWFLEP